MEQLLTITGQSFLVTESRFLISQTNKKHSNTNNALRLIVILHHQRPRRSEGVPGGGAAPRHPTPPILGGAGHDGAGTSGIRGGEGGEHTSPVGVPRARGPAGAAHYRCGGTASGGDADSVGGGGAGMGPSPH